jgi:chromate reductase
MKILAVCGSLQASSSNRKLLELAASQAPLGVEWVVFDGLDALPHFNPDLEEDGVVPPAVAVWRSALASSAGVMIASPEYGHSLPGVLKNAIDWVIGSGELVNKPVAVTAATGAMGRGALGLAAVLATLAAVDARVVGGHPIVRGAHAEAEVASLLRELVALVRRQSSSGSET